MTYNQTWLSMVDTECIYPEWQDYWKWLKDVTQLPGADPKATFQRIDTTLPYQPNNVRWVPKSKRGPQTGQPPTPRKNQIFHLAHNGEPITQAKAATLLNTNPNAFRQRLIYKSWRTGRTTFDLNEFLWD